jgi:hypothetical protein
MRNIFAAGLYLNARNGCRFNLHFKCWLLKRIPVERFIRQSNEGLLIVGNAYDPNVRISLRQLFEGTAQLCIYSKDQDTDHCAR